MSIKVHAGFQINAFGFFGYRLGNGSSGSYGNSTFSFLGDSVPSSIAAVPIPIHSVGGFLLLHSLSPAFAIYRPFTDDPPDSSSNLQ